MKWIRSLLSIAAAFYLSATSAYCELSVFVYGEVTSPGEHKLAEGKTFCDALVAAKLTRLSEEHRTRVWRIVPVSHGVEGTRMEQKYFDLDLDAGWDSPANGRLKDGDIIYVPPNHGGVPYTAPDSKTNPDDFYEGP